MAIYHLSAKIIGRSAGRSSVAAAAYRSGEAIRDQRTGTLHRFGRAHRVVHGEIVAQDGTPSWATDRASLWNAVEAGERRKDAQLSREFELALPRELDLPQQIDLLRGWLAETATPHGVLADVCIHDEGDGNPHAHVMTTLRAVDPSGEGFGPKLRHLNREIDTWREAWATHANAALERAGSRARIDHRSNEARGLEERPTIKIGPSRSPQRLALNRAIQAYNASLRRIRLRAAKLARSVANRAPTTAAAKSNPPEFIRSKGRPTPPSGPPDELDVATLAADRSGGGGAGRRGRRVNPL